MSFASADSSFLCCLDRAFNERICSCAALSLIEPLPMGRLVDDLEVPLLLPPLLGILKG